LTSAKARFENLAMAATRERSGVLLYFAPRSRQFAICGDAGIDAKCGPAFWQGTVAEVSARLRSGQFTEALVHAVQTVGALLGEHFPRRADDQDELSNEIARE